jgi:hypothetical protein
MAAKSLITCLLKALWEKFTPIYISFYKRFTTTGNIGAYVWLTQNQTIFYKTFEDNVQVVALSMANHKIQTETWRGSETNTYTLLT